MNKKKGPGKEYVDDTRAFYDATVLYCGFLPKKWEARTIMPLVEAAGVMEKDVILANRKAYINPNDDIDDQIKGYEMRIAYLSDALAHLDLFNIYFERMMRQIDTTDYEKRRMKSVIQKIIREERTQNKNADISVHFDEDAVTFKTAEGGKSVPLKLSASQISAWMDAEKKAEKSIKKRMSDDREQLKSIREKKEKQG